MVGIKIQDDMIAQKLKGRLSNLGYMVFDDIYDNLDLLIIENNGQSIDFADCKVILITADKDNPYINNCDYMMLLPINIELLVKLAETYLSDKINYTSKITELLLDLGISPISKGYLYLRDAIQIYVNHRNLYIKDIYSLVGLYRDAASKNVERNIRYAIETAFNKCRIESQEKLFGNSINPFKGKPTNMELISRFSDLIQLVK